MNNKGLTIIELIISIALISIIVLFMYRLLSDITFEKDNDFIATLNHQQRIEIIDAMQTIIQNDDAINDAVLSDDAKSLNFIDSTNRVLYSFSINPNTGVISISKAGTTLNKWKIKGGTLDRQINCKGSETYETYKIYSCIVPVYTTNINNQIINASRGTIDNNNNLDDIEL